MCLLVGASVYVQIWLTTGVLVPILPFVGMLSLIFLNIFFYLTLSILLGTLFSSRGAVLGIPLVVLFIYQIFPHIPAWLARLMPWNLVDSISHEALALTLVQGQALPTLTPIITTIIACLVFTLVASWRFSREEF
jgi:ABC-2 type transport system permease protein